MTTPVKHHITSRITLRLVVLLAIVLAIIFTGSYHIVNRIIQDEGENYAKAICSTFSDLLTYELTDTKRSYDSLDVPTMRSVADYFCSWYRIDYAFVYFPHVEDGTITLRFISAKESDEHSPDLKSVEDLTVEYSFKEDELAIYEDNTKYLISEDQLLPMVWEARIANRDANGNLMVTGIGLSRQRLREAVWERYWPFALVTGIVLLLMAEAIYLIIRHDVLDPAKKLSRAMESFIRDGRSVKLPESNRNDEFTMIAHAFNNMSGDIDTYIEDIRGLMQRQEQQQTTLNIAGGIQQSFLQAGSFRSSRCEIYAMMSPAADIGGDLYDYLVLDDDRILISIADVSGKGISASMFMAASLVLMRQLAKLGFSPAQILENTNDSLSGRNSRMLFITAFVAIYNSKTGVLTYANAGHNPPYVMHGRNTLHTIDGARNIVLGLFPGEKYIDAEEHLKAGDILFLYTDGVNEADNAQKEFFGNERIEKTLRSFAASHEEDPVSYMEKAVRDFAGGSEQHDDMTMLSMTVKENKSLLLPANREAIVKLREPILQAELPLELRMDLCLAAEEIFVNICSYAYPSPAPENADVRFDLEVSDRVLMRFTDRGAPYDPTQNVILPEEYDLSIGGLGKLIAFTVADSVHYAYEDETNILTIIKYIKEEPHDHPSDK